MQHLDRVRHWLRGVFRRRRVDREIDEELHDWVETLTDRHRSSGLAPVDARRAALRDLGSLDRIRDDTRPRMSGRFGGCWNDLRFSGRALRQAPGFTMAAILTFALGIGANTAIFSVVKTVLIEPLPYADADRLMFVWADVTDLGYPRAPLAGPELAEFQQQSQSFEALGGVWSTTATITGDGDPEQLRIATVTPDFFRLLGVPALHGAVIGPEHFGQSVRPVLLSHTLWRARFGGDPAVVGRRITMNDRPALVIGVMPAAFALLFPPDAAIPADLQAWVPGGARPGAEPRGQQYLRVVGRRRGAVSVAEAAREVSAIGAAIVRATPGAYTPNYRFYSVPMQADTVGAIRPALVAVFAGVAILLVIACVNIAGLLVVRASARRRETAVRLALGAGRGRLMRQYVLEGLLLSSAGGAAGVLLSFAGLAILTALAPPVLARVASTRVDTGVLLFAATTSIVWGLLFSLAPLSEIVRATVAPAFRQADRTNSGALHQRTRRVLVVVQIALGLLLLVGAALLARAFDRLLRLDIGFSADRVLTFRVSVPFARYGSIAAQNEFNRRLRAELSAVSGVESVGAISHLPYDNLPNWGTPYLLPGETDQSRAGLADARTVAPGFFETVRARLHAGRFFTEDDASPRPEVAIVIDEVFAAKVWPGQDAVGKTLIIDATTGGNLSSTARVIGVVGHLRHRAITDFGREQIFVSSRQAIRNPVAYVIRTAGDPTTYAAQIRAIVAKLDPQLPVYDLRALDTYLTGARAANRFTLVLAAIFAGVALVLAGVGVYGVVAYAASHRRREFGIRVAMGAMPRQITALVLGEGIRLVVVGVGIGLVGALMLSRHLQSQLFEIAPHDPAAYTAAVATLSVVALAACWLPIRRALASDPQRALRDE